MGVYCTDKCIVECGTNVYSKYNTNKSQAQTNHTQEQITEEFQEQNKQFLLLFGFTCQCDRVNGHTSPHTLKAYRHAE